MTFIVGGFTTFKNNFRFVSAFTLTEVLITLGIIGIVAAMTIPGLIQKYTERATVVKLKNTYAMLNQAVRKMIAENGELNGWSDDSREFFEQELIKHIKVVQKNTTYKDIMASSSFPWYGNPTYVLLNGSVIMVKKRVKNNYTASDWHTCETSVSAATRGSGIHYGSCAYLLVDLNGKAKPNKAGQDMFEFRVYTDGVLPKGIPLSDSNDSFKNCNSSSSVDNYNCTAWVIYNNNLDYLHCRDKLDWNKAKSCKEK